jgi:hypothetical protein
MTKIEQDTINMSEIQIQAKGYQYLYNNYPQLRGCLFHVPNGGTRNKAEASQLKASGVTSGIPDLLLIHNGKLFACEVKKPIHQNETNKGCSSFQLYIHKIWAQNGCFVTIAFSSQQIIEWAINCIGI